MKTAIPTIKPTAPTGDGLATRAEILKSLSTDRQTFDQARRRFPIRWPTYYLDLVGDSPETDPIANMGRPHPEEERTDRGDIRDPVADRLLRPVPFVVRKHRDRVIILATKQCHFYCRFCFRREEPVNRTNQPSEQDWRVILNFLETHPEIEEPILSGGDPLTLDNDMLFGIRNRFEAIPSLRRWRIHSRAPVHFPLRITRPLLQGLRGRLPLTIVTHYNHAKELTDEARRVAGQMHGAEIGYQNQAVLLAGVNDDVEEQVRLWRGLAELGIVPHYLHHPDRARGNARFRLSIDRGLAIFKQAREQLGPSAPRYVLDLPDGRGKVSVEELVAVDAGNYRYTHPDGIISHYRDIDSAAG